MSSFTVTLEIGDSSGQRFESIEAMLDTGATYTWVPASFLERLGLRPTDQWLFELADGRQVHYGIAWTQARLAGDTQPTVVIFGDEGTSPLLGVFTLEGFRLAADPVNHRLIPVPALLKPAILRP